MADLNTQTISRISWTEITGVQGKTWLFQNTGRYDLRIFITDGAAPADNSIDGEIIKSHEWSKEPLSVEAGEAVWATGDTNVFMREVV